MKKVVSILILGIIILGMLGGCTAITQTTSSAQTSETQASTSSATTNSTSTTSEKKFTVGIVAYHFADQFCKWLMNSFETDLQKNYPSIEYKITDGQGKVDATIAAIEQFTTQKVDIIILQPFDSNAFLPAVKNALAAGIKVVCTNVGINDNGESPYVIDDFIAQGKAQADYYIDKIPQNAEIAILKGVPADCANLRREGLQSLLDERKDIKLVADLSANWRKEEAMKITEDWLLKFPNLQYILAQSDEMAMGAVEALRAVNKIGKVKVAAVGATAQGCVAIKNGELDMCVLEDAGQMAVLTNALVWKILNNQPYEKHQYIPNPVVDMSNVDQYLKMHQEAGNLNQ